MASPDRVDHGFTHVALTVRDLDAAIGFFATYASLQVVHRRSGDHDGADVAWMGDLSRPFVVVLIQTETASHPLGGWNHLGVGVDTRAEVDRRAVLARSDGWTVVGPLDEGPPVGYFAVIIGPDGHQLEVAFGQEVALAVRDASGPGSAGK
ncbi:MAG: VOC family protein [Acidimicrobiales bacterium]|jgi:catechol 2,3-dioxygenase-like lactoylglutathione lyase family enzyme|nr:VOC family protein [Acidimicrobiales bacterium]